ncbi:MAG: hypothetical protein ABIK65_05165 [Candidatus Eisenbacteria bacterium]
MIGLLRIALPVLVIHILESTLLYRTGPVFSRIDWMLLFVAFAVFGRGAGRGLMIGAGVGLFRDIAAFADVGPELLATGAAAAFAAWAHRKLVGESTPGLLLILFGVLLVHDGVRFLPFLRHGLLPFAARFAVDTIPAAVLTALTGALVREGRLFARRRAEAAA